MVLSKAQLAASVLLQLLNSYWSRVSDWFRYKQCSFISTSFFVSAATILME